MESAPPNTPLSFEVTFDRNDLNVAMSVYEIVDLVSTLVFGPEEMVNIVGNTYVGEFTAQPNKTYVIFKAVYTNDSFTTLDSNYSQGSESIVTVTSGGGGGGSSDCGDIVGLVDSNNEVTGYVDNNNVVVGLVTC